MATMKYRADDGKFYDIKLGLMPQAYITAPSGSTVHIQKDGTDVNTYSGTGSGEWVELPDYGDYSVYITDGTNTSEPKNISVDDVKRYDNINLSYYSTYTVKIEEDMSNPDKRCTYADGAIDMSPGWDNWKGKIFSNQ